MLFSILFMSPLVLGAYVAVQRADSTLIRGWFSLITVVCLAVLIVGAAVLLTMLS
jgi:hypothetical protein